MNNINKNIALTFLRTIFFDTPVPTGVDMRGFFYMHQQISGINIRLTIAPRYFKEKLKRFQGL